MLGKMPNVLWFEGDFVESVKGWQLGWFYITEPRDPTWAAAPEFRSGIPTQLTSWKEKGLLWGSSEELTGLQACIQKLVKKVRLVNMVQVMLVRRILPCQRRAFNLWEFNAAQQQTLRELFDTTHKDVWKVLFKAVEVPPTTTKDRGHIAKRPANPVSSLYFTRCAFPQYVRGRNLSHHTDLTGLSGDSGVDRLSSSVA